MEGGDLFGSLARLLAVTRRLFPLPAPAPCSRTALRGHRSPSASHIKKANPLVSHSVYTRPWRRPVRIKRLVFAWWSNQPEQPLMSRSSTTALNRRPKSMWHCKSAQMCQVVLLPFALLAAAVDPACGKPYLLPRELFNRGSLVLVTGFLDFFFFPSPVLTAET